MSNAGGTIDLVLDLGMNFDSSQTVCSTENCDSSADPIFLVSGSITTVPEPGTALLMGLGLAGLGGVGRSRRRQESKSTT